MIRFALLVISILFLITPAKAQDLSETLSRVGEAYARVYVNPLAEALGADLNTGLFHTAGVSKRVFGVNVYIGFKASAAMLNNSHKSFDLVYKDTVPLDFDLAGQTITLDVPATLTVDDAPTFFGEDIEGFINVTVDHDTTFSTLGLTLPVSFDSTLASIESIGGQFPTGVAPFIVPQIGLGTVLGTDIMVRWLPKITVTSNSVDRTVQLFGFGVRHNLNQYLPVLPFDLSIQVAWQQFTFHEFNLYTFDLDANTFAVNVAASKRIGILTVYGGLQSERSDIDFGYDELEVGELEPTRIDFTLTQKGKTRGIFGFGLKMGPVILNTDVSVGQFTVVSAGLGFAF